MTQIGLNFPRLHHQHRRRLAYLEHNRFPNPDEEVKSHMQGAGEEDRQGFRLRHGIRLLCRYVPARDVDAGLWTPFSTLGLNRRRRGIIKLPEIRFGYDATALHPLYGKIALGVPDEKFDEGDGRTEKGRTASSRTWISAPSSSSSVRTFAEIVKSHTGKAFRMIPTSSWKSRSRQCSAPGWASAPVDYRKQFKITKDMANGTAVNVVHHGVRQHGQRFRTGVGFTRNPGTGANEP